MKRYIRSSEVSDIVSIHGRIYYSSSLDYGQSGLTDGTFEITGIFKDDKNNTYYEVKALEDSSAAFEGKTYYTRGSGMQKIER